MDEQALAQLISKTAVLMEQFDRRSGDIDQRLQALGDELQHVAWQVPAIVRQSADDSLTSLPVLVMDQISGGLVRSMHDHRKRMDHAGREVETASLTLSSHIARMEHLHRLLVWKAIGATAVCLALLLAGGMWLSMHYARVIRENQLSAEMLRAYSRADVAICGKGRLCVRVDSKGLRYGEHAQYVPVLRR